MHETDGAPAGGMPHRPHAVPPRQKRLNAAGFRRYLVELGATGVWTPWAEFVDTTHKYLAPVRRADNSLEAWGHVRERVLGELSELGLDAHVVRTDGETPELGEHEADLAGLVRLYPDRGPWSPEPLSVPSSVWYSRDTYARHALRMLGEHGLVLADERIPRRPRSFCGQSALSNHEVQADRWDHVHSWVGVGDEPALTVAPYNHAGDPRALMTIVRDYVRAEQLPLVAAGPYPGVWHESTTLVVLRYDTAAAPLQAEHAVWRAWPWAGAKALLAGESNYLRGGSWERA
ncbi:MAG: hypothetical protein DLM57_12505 [Pseudonocardiales bacterium]|nr:MAG: hypothetical protein DLM57_12505 [Pseudonocardiales bacterium]